MLMKYLYLPHNAQCPICSNTHNQLYYKVTSKESAMHFLVNHGISLNRLGDIEEKITKLWGKSSAAIVSCTNCGFVFADPFISGDYEFYNLLPHSADDGSGPVNWKWEFDITYKKIASIAAADNNISLLEIGASTGGFAKRVSSLIKKENILCLEHSEIGVNSIKRAGIEAHTWNFHELGHKPGFLNRFNIICLFQVLEHLDKLDDTFKTFNAVIKAGGHLFIGVPNADKIKFNELNGALLDMPPNHIGRFNKSSFEALAGRHGWEIANFATEIYTPLDVMKTVMYYRSLRRAQLPPVKETLWYNIKQYIEIKYIRLQAMFMHKHLGEALWIHLIKK
jgi:2-polyprenyl-3-methyl-5-hydroxy-6-metoxy-1,4-benzoquinol methylase